MALSIVILAAGAHASGVDPAGEVPLCTTPHLRGSEFAASDGFGGMLVTWVDLRNDSLGDIYVQRLDERGGLRWQANGVEVCAASGVQSQPSAASDGEGGAWLAWLDRRGTFARVYVQHVSAAGRTTLEPNGKPLGDADEFGFDPSVVGDGTGGAIAGWLESTGTGFAHAAQRIDRGGALLWLPQGVAIDSSSSQFLIRRARWLPGSLGEAIVVSEAPAGVTLRKLASNGAPAWPDSIVVACACVFDNLGAVGDGSGGALLTWSAGSSAAGDSVMAQHITSDGRPEWGPCGRVVFADPEPQATPAISPGDDGGAYVVWRNDGFANPRIFAQRLDHEGGRMWGTSAIHIAPIGRNQRLVGARAVSGGGLVVAWQATISSPGDLFAQRLDGEGQPMWAPDGAPLTSASGRSSNPHLELRDGAGAAMVWEGVHEGSRAIVSSALGPFGFPGTAPARAGADGVFLWSPAPSPARSEVTIRFALRSPLPLTLAIHDLAGRRIRLLAQGSTSEGPHAIVWDGTGDDHARCAAGVYFVRCTTATAALTTKLTLLR